METYDYLVSFFHIGHCAIIGDYIVVGIFCQNENIG